MGIDATEFQALGTGLSDRLTKTVINVVLSGGLAFASYIIDNHLTVRHPESSIDWASTRGKAPYCRPNLGYTLGKATHLRDATRTLAASMSQPASRSVYDFRPSTPQSELSTGWVLGIAMCAIIMTIAASFLCQYDNLKFDKPVPASSVSPGGRSSTSEASVPVQRVGSSSRSRGSGADQSPPRQSNTTAPFVKVDPPEPPLQYITSDRGDPPPPPPSSSAANEPWDHSGWKFIILVLIACFILGLVTLIYRLVPSKFRYWLCTHFGRSLPHNIDTPAAVIVPTKRASHSKSSHSTPPNCSNIIPLSSRSPVATRSHPSPSVQPFKINSPQRQINIVKTLNIFRDRVYAPLVGTVGVFLASLSLVYLFARHRFDHSRFSGYDIHKTEPKFEVDDAVSEGEVAAVDLTVIPDRLELVVDNFQVEVSEVVENAVAVDPKVYIADDFDVAGDIAEETLEMARPIDVATEVETADEDAISTISIAGTDDLSSQIVDAVEAIDQIDGVPKVKLGDEQDGNKACIATDYDLVDESAEVLGPIDAVEETKIIYSHLITSNIEDEGRVEDAISVEPTSPTLPDIVPILDTAPGNESTDIEIPRDFNTSIILEPATIEEASVVSSLLTILEEEPAFGCEIIPSDTVVTPHETGIVGDEEVDYIHESLGQCESHTELEQAPQQLLPLHQQDLIHIRNHRQETQHIARYVNHINSSGPRTWGRSPMNVNPTSLNPVSKPFVPLSHRPPSHPQSRGMVQDPMHIYRSMGVPTHYPQPQPGFQSTASQNYDMSRYQASTQARSFHDGNFTRGASHPDQYGNGSSAYQDNRRLFQRSQPMAPSHPSHTLPSTFGRSMGGFLPSRAHEMQPLAVVPTHGYSSVSSSSYGGTPYIARHTSEEQRFGGHHASSSFSPNYNDNVYPGMTSSASMTPRLSFSPYNDTRLFPLPDPLTRFYGGYIQSVSAPLAHNNDNTPHWASLAEQNYTTGQVLQGHDGRPQGLSQGLWPVNSQNTRIQPAPVARRGEVSMLPLTGYASTSYHPIDDLFPQAGQSGRSSTDSVWAPAGRSGSSTMASSQNAGAITIAIGRSSVRADNEGSGEQTKSSIKRQNRRARYDRLKLQAARRRPQGTIVEVENEETETTEADPTEASTALLLSDTTAASSDLVQQPFPDSAWHLAVSHHPNAAPTSLQDVIQPPNSPRVAVPSPINNVHSRHPHLDLHPQTAPNRQTTSRGRRLGATQSWNDIQDEDRRQE